MVETQIKTRQSPDLDKSLREIAELVGGEISGDANLRVKGACGVLQAQAGDITFLSDRRHLHHLSKTRASAVIISPDVQWHEKPTIKVSNPSQAFLKVMKMWETRHYAVSTGIHPKAVIAPSARLADDVAIGPGTVVEEGCRIGRGSTILANCFIGRESRIGENALIHPNVTILERSSIGDRVILHPGAVIGADGYGYELIDQKLVKVPQMGNVELQADVEIGAHSCVDRARFGTTLIKKGTKVDNLVQIAHNVVIGENCLIVSQTGIAGSSELGDYVILAAQVGVVDHVKIGSQSKVGAQSGVYTSIPEKSVVLGSPPLPVREEKERIVYNHRLPQLFKDVKEIKKKLDDLSSK